MLSSQFNSGYRHQLTIKPLVKGFFDAFVFKVYEKCTIFYFRDFGRCFEFLWITVLNIDNRVGFMVVGVLIFKLLIYFFVKQINGAT